MSIIVVTQPNDGETADAVDVNDQINAILAGVNGGLDSDNLAAGAVGTTELQDGSVTPDKLSAVAKQGWLDTAQLPNSCSYNGQRSYNLVFNGVDLTSVISPGARLRLGRSSAAPTKSTSLNGTTQFYTKTSPSGMTFTDDFTVSAWIKLSSYNGTAQNIVTRFNGTSGWGMYVSANGQLVLYGNNAGGGNFSQITSYQSIPLNEWVHVAAQLDMSTFTATTTTSYIMFDGVDVPSAVSRAGTNPTALVQAGNLEVGSTNGGTLPFGGKIAQLVIYNNKVAQATIQAALNQTMVGNETSVISAYSFNNSVNDLNTGNANNLTPSGSAVATNTDSPFAQAATAGVYEYAIVQSASFSTNTTLVVQVPKGCALPTTGGFGTSVYSSDRAPYNFPSDAGLWEVGIILANNLVPSSLADGTYNPNGAFVRVPLGAWLVNGHVTTYTSRTGAGPQQGNFFLSTTTSIAGIIQRTLVGHYGNSGISIDWQGDNAFSLPYSTTVAIPVYLMFQISGANAAAAVRGELPGPSYVSFRNAYI